jgi:hypothetical protein
MAKMKRKPTTKPKRHRGAVPETRDDLENLNAMGSRLRQLRLYKAMTGPKFAEWLGIEYPRWNNFERGYPLPMKVALLICRKMPGVTLDWLYREQTSRMEHELVERIQNAVDAMRAD